MAGPPGRPRGTGRVGWPAKEESRTVSRWYRDQTGQDLPAVFPCAAPPPPRFTGGGGPGLTRWWWGRAVCTGPVYRTRVSPLGPWEAGVTTPHGPGSRGGFWAPIHPGDDRTGLLGECARAEVNSQGNQAVRVQAGARRQSADSGTWAEAFSESRAQERPQGAKSRRSVAGVVCDSGGSGYSGQGQP